jgi:serine O-acetyltransferase
MSQHSGSAKEPRAFVSADTPDWSREAKAFWSWHPSRSLLASLRAYQKVRGRAGLLSSLWRLIAILRHRFWTAVTGADIPLGCQIEGGLILPHPNGIVIHPDSKIGPNCLLMQQVTLGTRGSTPGVPVLVGRVDIGAGAKVLGGVTLGAHCEIGANAVVLTDVPTEATAVGIPARIMLSASAQSTAGNPKENV